jgi:hypothetical protein
MRGNDERRDGLFSYVRTESRIPNNHPLRLIRGVADEALKAMAGFSWSARSFIYAIGERPYFSKSRFSASFTSSYWSLSSSSAI